MGRRKASCNRQGAFSPEAFWHGAFHGSDVMQEFGRRVFELTPTARMAAGPTVPESTFDYLDASCSLPAAGLEELKMEHPTSWVPVAADGIKQSGLRTVLGTIAEGNWRKIEMAWQSLLLLPGTLAKRRGEQGVKFVLSSP